VTERRGGIGGLREWSGGGGVLWFAEVLFACFALGGFGAAALGAAGLGGGLVGVFGVLELFRVFGVFSGILRCGRFGGGFAIWSGGCVVFRFCQVLFSLVQNLGGLVQVVCGRRGGFASGEGGGFEFVGGEAVFAQQGDHGAAVLAVEPDDVGRGNLSDERGGAVVLQLGVLEQGFEGVGVGELAELLCGVFEPFEDVVVGDGLDDLGEGFVEEAEVGVDGGAGDVELRGDLAEGVSALVELVGVEDALASFGVGGHGWVLSRY